MQCIQRYTVCGYLAYCLILILPVFRPVTLLSCVRTINESSQLRDSSIQKIRVGLYSPRNVFQTLDFAVSRKINTPHAGYACQSADCRKLMRTTDSQKAVGLQKAEDDDSCDKLTDLLTVV